MGSRSSTNEAPPVPTILVGSIRQPHGLGGEVMVEVLTDVPRRFERGSELLITRPGPGAGSQTRVERRVTVVSARRHRGGLRVRFEGFSDRDAVEELRGANLEIEASAGVPAPEGTFYHYELLGCRCVDLHEGDLGEIVDLVEDGGGLLLMVERQGLRLPIPFVKSFLVEVDPAGKRIELDLPPGLVEICTSRS